MLVHGESLNFFILIREVGYLPEDKKGQPYACLSKALLLKTSLSPSGWDFYKLKGKRRLGELSL
jgi:hypothetical protein